MYYAMTVDPRERNTEDDQRAANTDSLFADMAEESEDDGDDLQEDVAEEDEDM